MKKDFLKQNKELLKTLSAEDILRWSYKEFGNDVVFASSMGLEDQIVIDMIYRLKLNIPIFTLDTGRLFNETYELITETEKRYDIKIKIFFPNSSAVEKMVYDKGLNLFYKGEKERKQCCHVRKIEPLKRALKPYSAWICGLRNTQSVTRENLHIADWDEGNMMVKVNPLISWEEKNLWDYIKKHNVPYNQLHDKSFLSIGCACCTRAVKPGEDIRAGRWWWETPEQKECGLHIIDGKVARKNVEK